MKLAFSYHLTSPSMAEASFADDRSEVHLDVWHITPDPLGDLIRAIIAILNNKSDGRCAWEDDPGQHRLYLHRHDDKVRFIIRSFETTFSTAEDESGTLLFSTEYPLVRFAIKVRNEFRRLLGEWGTAGYEAYWGQAFPHVRLVQLDTLIRERAHRARSDTK